MTARALHTKPRWSQEDYREALGILRGATIEGAGGREYKLFKGLTARNGFDMQRPGRITRSKRHTIKKLLSDLSVIRSRRMIGVNPRKTRRRTFAKNASGFRSPYMSAIPLPVLPSVRAEVKWSKDRPVVVYPRQNVKSMTVPVNKSFMRKVMRDVEESGGDIDDVDDAIADTIEKQVRQAIRDMQPVLSKGDVIRFRLQTIYGGLDAGSRVAVSDDIKALIENVSEFINQYFEKDKEGNFFVGFTLWAASPQKTVAIGSTFKRPSASVERESKAAKKRRRIKGR